MVDEPAVKVTRDGPYQVRGQVPLVRTAQVETGFGEPIAWAPDEPVQPSRVTPPGEPIELCRCGRSSTKPFCDGSHARTGFDGTEVADRGTYADRAHPYLGQGLTMFDQHTLCTQAGYCGDRFANVWAMIEREDDPETRERIRTMSALCPSGRLLTRVEATGEVDEPPYEPSVAVVTDGPLWVRGGVRVEAADGETYEIRNRVTLCRCGGSGNKPFCDGTHKDIGFRDP
jgi:CDGSH-type Zn-finger protein